MKFVILAAGKGTRVGRAGKNLHKALLPLDGMAILSHQLELAPMSADIIIAVGDRADQIKDYVRLAHPSMAQRITFVTVPGWDSASGGPGASLIATRDIVGDNDMVYVSCDTLWSKDDVIWDDPNSWVGVAPIPPGTPLNQWCRFTVFNNYVTEMFDKTSHDTHAHAFIGLAHIRAEDLHKFWHAIIRFNNVQQETRDVAGFIPLIADGVLHTHHVDWTDTGTEESYRRAIARISGYDWTKLDQATYVIPNEQRVIKYMADIKHVKNRYDRGIHLSHVTPKCVTRATNMLAYDYQSGKSVYDALANINYDDDYHVIRRLLDWHKKNLTHYIAGVDNDELLHTTLNFYRDKTQSRILHLSSYLRDQATDAIQFINWDELVKDCWPVHGHGDFNFGNIIISDDESTFTAIDWREDFAGAQWIDMRYDIAKLLAGTVVHWDNARRGDFRPWSVGEYYGNIIRSYFKSMFPYGWKSIEIIAALSLINSAPLHASPLDEILIARATYWLGQLL